MPVQNQRISIVLGNVTPLASLLLRLVGLDETQRHVFLSYRRHHGEQTALQLRRALIDDGWRVFLDQFSIDPGADFQVQLFRDLDEKALLVVIETAQTRDSAWVDDELAFAHANGIGIRAVQFPLGGRLNRFPPSATHVVRRADLKRRPQPKRAKAPGEAHNHPRAITRKRAVAEVLELTDHCVASLLPLLQQDHTQSFWLRREDLATTVHRWLSAVATEVHQVADDMFIGVQSMNDLGKTTKLVVLPTVRRPSLGDIYRVAREVASAGDDAEGLVVHRLTDPDKTHIDQLQWVGGRCRVRLTPVVQLVHPRPAEGTTPMHRIFMSASFPVAARQQESGSYDDRHIGMATTALSRAVLARGHELVFGGHPSVTPMVQTALSDESTGCVMAYQSEYFTESPREMTRLAEFTRVRVEMVPSTTGRDDSLALLRDAMLAPRPAAGFFVGGMSGIDAEFQRLGRLHQECPRFLFVRPGGRAAKLAGELVGDGIASSADGVRELVPGDATKAPVYGIYGVGYDSLVASALDLVAETPGPGRTTRCH